MLPLEQTRACSYAAAFASALVDPECETPAIVAGPAGKSAVKRYNVYRNNVTVSLIDAEADGRAIARRGRRVGSAEFLLVRPCRKHRRNDPGGRVHRRRSRRSMMVIDQRYDSSERFRLGLLADKANHLIQRAALPSLVQLVMRVALAVPFWRSGILKWDGLLKLSDTAVTLFTDEFTLHLPGRALSLSGADCDGVPFRMWRNPVSGAAGARLGYALRRARTAFHDGRR
jgi:hypothetical protein